MLAAAPKAGFGVSTGVSAVDKVNSELENRTKGLSEWELQVLESAAKAAVARAAATTAAAIRATTASRLQDFKPSDHLLAETDADGKKGEGDNLSNTASSNALLEESGGDEDSLLGGPQMLHFDAEELDQPQLDAVLRWNRIHMDVGNGAFGLLTSEKLGHNLKQLGAFGGSVNEVRRNKLYVERKHEEADISRVTIKARFKPRKKWSLDDSIFMPRKFTGNCRSLLEDDSSLLKMLKADWKMARKGHGLEGAMIKQAGEWRDEDGDGVHDELDEVFEVLFNYRHTIFGAFDYYCALFDNGKTKHGEITDAFDVSFNAFLEFTRDCGLTNEHCKGRDMEMIWVQVNAIEESTRAMDKFNKLNFFNRHEFLQAIIRIALKLYVQPGIIDDVSDAIEATLEKIEQGVPAEALQDSNLFREKHCYNPHVDAVLKRNQGTLKAMFNLYSKGNTDRTDMLQSDRQMSMGEWLTFLEHMDLFETGQLSPFGAKMIFMWSRMRAQSDYSEREEAKMRNLSYEDWMEALVRVSMIMALPTDQDLKEARLPNAGDYMMQLMHDPHEMGRWVSSHKVGWQKEPRQRAFRCLHHFLNFLVRIIEENTSREAFGAADGEVGDSEIAVFNKRRKAGALLSMACADTSLLDGIRASMSIVRQRLLEALQSIEVFHGLTSEQFECLRDSMTQAPFKAGEYVFEQGDVGDAFYVIIEGSAEVLRDNEDGEPEVCLAELSEGAYFGERALIKDQLRFAAVKAKSPELRLMGITRGEFEEALGEKLEDLIPDTYELNKEELLKRMVKVELFQGIPEDKMKGLVDLMVEVTIERGGFVFEQGDHGDAMFIIVDGEAEVLREDRGHEKLLATLQRGAHFGERALLKGETRYAGIKAKSRRLRVMRITKDEFEAFLGPLQKYKEQLEKGHTAKPKADSKASAKGKVGKSGPGPKNGPRKRNSQTVVDGHAGKAERNAAGKDRKSKGL